MSIVKNKVQDYAIHTVYTLVHSDSNGSLSGWIWIMVGLFTRGQSSSVDTGEIRKPGSHVHHQEEGPGLCDSYGLQSLVHSDSNDSLSCWIWIIIGLYTRGQSSDIWFMWTIY